MKRSTFLKTLGLGTSGLFVGNVPGAFAQERIKIYENYVQGIFYCDFEKAYGQLKPGSPLELTREPNNEYDRFAIMVLFGDQKLGYLPAYENITLAHLMDKGVHLQAFANRINDHEKKPFFALSIEIYAEMVLQNEAEPDEKLSSTPADDVNDHYRNPI